MFTKNKYYMYILSFLDLFSISMLIPLFGARLKTLGASHLTIGLVGSFYSGLQIISGPVIGSWSDVRNRKHILQATLSTCSLCYLVLGFAKSIYLIILLRMLLGSVKHTQSIYRAMMADLFPPNMQVEILGRSSAFGTVAFTIGPFFGGLIADVPDGFSYICLVVFTLFIFCIGLSILLPNVEPRYQRKPSKSIVQEFDNVKSNLRNVDWSKNWEIFTLRLFFGIASSIFFHNHAIYVQEVYKLNQKQTGFLISFVGILQTCTIVSLGYIRKIFYKNDQNSRRIICHAFLLFTLSSCFIFSSAVSDFTQFVIFLVPLAVSMSILRISTMELMFESSGKDKRGTFSGVSNSIMSLSRLISPLMSGIVGDGLSIRAAISSAILPAVLGCLISMRRR